MATWAGPRDTAWARLTADLGIRAAARTGDRVEIETADGATLSGSVVDASPTRVGLLIDEPAPGTAFLAVEGAGDKVELSIWSYLYGPEGVAAPARDAPRWQAWLTERAA